MRHENKLLLPEIGTSDVSMQFVRVELKTPATQPSE